jgi:hypothetical protein
MGLFHASPSVGRALLAGFLVSGMTASRKEENGRTLRGLPIF